MAHDREFQRRRKDTRMPVRDSHGEDQPAARQTEQDFDLRRARDTPSSVNGKTHRQDIPVQTEFSHLSPETPASLLEQGDAYAAALDVVREEPIRNDNPLLECDNCLITPHISWASKEARRRIMDTAVENLRCFLQGKEQNRIV